MKKIVRLTESDLARLVKRVINEQEDDGKIRIPSQYGGVRMELGKEVSPEEIINSYNEIVDGTPLVSYSEYGTKGMFYNEDNDEIPLDVVLDELDYAITGGEDDDMGDSFSVVDKNTSNKNEFTLNSDNKIVFDENLNKYLFRYKSGKSFGVVKLTDDKLSSLIDFLTKNR